MASPGRPPRGVLAAGGAGLACALLLLACQSRDHRLAAVVDGRPGDAARDGAADGVAPGAILSVRAGCNASCALHSERGLICWGEQVAGLFAGGGAPTPLEANRTQGFPQSARDPRSFDLYGAYTVRGGVLVQGDGTLIEWEGGSFTAVPELADVAEVARVSLINIAEGEGLCARLASGTVLCRDEVGEVQPVAGLDDAVQIDAGADHYCAVRQGGTVICWGANEHGQLGDGTTEERELPVQVAGVADAVQVAAGGWASCALRGGGTVVCWGHLGEPAAETAQPVLGLEGIVQLDLARLALGLAQDFGCAVQGDGRVICWSFWGVNERPIPADQLVQLEVAGTTIDARRYAGIDDALEVSVGLYSASILDGLHACARRRGGVSCWGANNYGQLGDGLILGGSEIYADDPVAVIGLP